MIYYRGKIFTGGPIALPHAEIFINCLRRHLKRQNTSKKADENAYDQLPLFWTCLNTQLTWRQFSKQTLGLPLVSSLL